MGRATLPLRDSQGSDEPNWNLIAETDNDFLC
jgi:hypothetical protein